MMWRALTATVLLVLAMGSTDRKQAGLLYFLMPFMVLFAVAFIIDAARRSKL